MSNPPPLTYRTFLQREFAIRKRRNPGYSLRAYARDLGIPAPKLSQALRGIRGISGARAAELADRLRLSDNEREFFITLVEAEHSRSHAGKVQAKKAVDELIAEQGFKELDLERFRIISDWHHFALLELTEVKDFDPSPAWIANRLGISVTQTRQAIQRLLDFGLLKESRGSIVQTHADLATPSGIPSRELREHHSQLIAKADQSLEQVPIDERDISAVTLAIAPQDLPKARKILKELRRRFAQELQATPEKERVYCLAIQFFPLDQVSRKEK